MQNKVIAISTAGIAAGAPRLNGAEALIRGNAIEYVHEVPGRVRVRSSFLKKNESGLSQLRRRLELLPGIRAIEANSMTGSLTVYFSERFTSAEIVLWALQRQGLSLPAVRRARATVPSNGALQKAIGKAGKALGVFLLEEALKKSVVGIAAALL